jgi:uncharacterized protein
MEARFRFCAERNDLRLPYPWGRFVPDRHLARLAVYLRLMGLDAPHRRHFPDREPARIATEDDQVLLTRDKGLLMRSAAVHGGFVRAADPRAQLPEVLHRFGARECYAPFTRCLACNGMLVPAAKADEGWLMHPDPA